MAIELTCPACGQTLKLKEEAAGKRGRCPKCQAVITVPAGSAAQSTEDHGPRPEPAPPTPSSVTPPVPASPARPAPLHQGTCPSCGGGLAPVAVICVNCGLNLRTGQKLQTMFGPAEGEEEPPKKPPVPDKGVPEGPPTT